MLVVSSIRVTTSQMRQKWRTSWFCAINCHFFLGNCWIVSHACSAAAERRTRSSLEWSLSAMHREPVRLGKWRASAVLLVPARKELSAAVCLTARCWEHVHVNVCPLLARCPAGGCLLLMFAPQLCIAMDYFALWAASRRRQLAVTALRLQLDMLQLAGVCSAAGLCVIVFSGVDHFPVLPLTGLWQAA
jgi:hypothetical protein